jgi:hypothetical protein
MNISDNSNQLEAKIETPVKVMISKSNQVSFQPINDGVIKEIKRLEYMPWDTKGYAHQSDHKASGEATFYIMYFTDGREVLNSGKSTNVQNILSVMDNYHMIKSERGPFIYERINKESVDPVNIDDLRARIE